ncbi:MAG: diacylglycerol kinase family lipid kinase [Gemmatimonadetes bacterium]|nr:diacylglycerol kinase family lipid kinase [Gemmatimonadota bacterium]
MATPDPLASAERVTTPEEPMRTCVIVNPKSGSVRHLSDMMSRIRQHPALQEPEFRLTDGRAGGTALARAAVEEGFTRILSVGGDGTLNEVVNGVGPHREGVVVGVLPTGTGNDFARSIGFPNDLDEALEALVGAVERATDVIRVSGGVERLCVNCAAGGFSGQVDEELTPQMKQSWGPLAYLRSAWEVLPDLTDYHTELALDGEPPIPLDCVNVVVANGRTAAGGIPVAPASRLDDGLLDVMVVKLAPLRELTGVASRIVAGRHLEHDLILFRQARRASIASRPGMWFNLDGELLTREPLTFEVLPGALTVITAPNAPAFGAD